VCYEQLTLVQKILEGTVEVDHYFGVIFAIDDGDDPLDERVWLKANPLLVDPPTLEKMRYTPPRQSNRHFDLVGFRDGKRCNRWSGAAQAWLNLRSLMRAGSQLEFRAVREARRARSGLDLSDCNDMTAAVLVCPASASPCFRFLFGPPSLSGRRPGRRRRTMRHGQGGLLELTDGNAIDPQSDRADVRSWSQRFDVQAVVGDRCNPRSCRRRSRPTGSPRRRCPRNAIT
jgi:phage terminase large subunit-like protein